MSVRMLRRALREKQPLDLAEKEESETEEERPSAGNIFSHLQDDDLVPDRDEEEEEESPKPSTSLPLLKQVSRPGKPAKKKKKKGGKVKNPTPPPEEQQLHEDEDEVAELIEKMTRTSTSDVKEKRASRADKVAAVISVDPKRLKAEDELRHIFGSKVINSVERSNARRLRGTRQQHPLQRGRKLLVAPMSSWPRWDGGVSMELKDTSKDGVMHFRYVYSPAYMRTQDEYKQCVATHDPNLIALLVASHPYHVDSLLSLAEVFKHTGEPQQAASLVERCLYALECAWHPSFNPTGGKCRLEYACDENKPLFLALFRHMQHLGRRGCHRTALEVCKLLLSLDLDDPLGVRFCVDYYALRAEQYAWLESFVADFYEDTSVALLPNFSLSLAIARFYLEQKEVRGDERDVVPSSDLLQQALMLHPLVLSRIVTRAPVKEDAEWKALLQHPLFSKATAGGPSLDHLLSIYIERNYLLWRIPQLQVWLKAAATSVINKQDGGGEAASWACARTEAFQADHNEYQHLSLSEFSDATPTLPPDEPQPQGNILPAGPEGHEQVPADRNALLVFLESLLPWINYGNLDHGEESEEENEEQEQEQD